MGYIGQTLRDFLDEAIDNDGNITLSDINEDDFEDSIVYEGSISDIPEELLDCEFSEFDTGEGITINVSEEGFSRYYTTLEDFLEDCNEYNITIWDTDLEKIIYDGDKYDIPDEILEMGFESFDMPTNICCNIDAEDYDRDEDIDIEDCRFKDSNETTYSYTGPIKRFGRTVKNNWSAKTKAVSLDKAYSNLLFQAKKYLGLVTSAKVEINKSNIIKETKTADHRYRRH